MVTVDYQADSSPSHMERGGIYQMRADQITSLTALHKVTGEGDDELPVADETGRSSSINWKGLSSPSNLFVKNPSIYFQSRWRHNKHGLPTQHNYIKITTELYNNRHSEPSEIELNGSLTTTELKKPHPSRQVGDTEMQKGLVPHSYVVDKNSWGISQEQRVPAPY